MKSRVLGVIFALFAVSFYFAQDDMPVSRASMPAAVKRSVTKYFGNKAISHITKDREDGRVVYDIYFEDGSEAEIASNGTLWEAKSYNGLSNAVVSAKIKSYVQRNFPGSTVVKWERKWNKQQIELDNDLDLEFDLKGRFLRMDD